MARTYTDLPPLWWLEEHLELSDKYPSGLAWKTKNSFHEPGDMAGKPRPHGRYYCLCLLGTKYTAHRVVYYMRTGQNPGNADVMHGADNPERDNRMELTLYQRKPVPAPKWRRRVRDADGNLVYSDRYKDGFSIRDIERETGLKIIR